MQQVIIHNLDPSPIVVYKDHNRWCVPLGKCECKTQRTRTYDHDNNINSKTAGTKLERPINVKTATSFTLWGRKKSNPLPEQVLQLPQIAGLMRANPRRIRIIRV